MPKFLTVVVLIAAFSVTANAQFNKSDIDDLKADLINFANSNCKDKQYLRSATDLIGRLSTPISNAITPDQARANNQLRDALSGVREGLLAAMLNDQASCSRIIKVGIQQLDSLPLNAQPDELESEGSGDIVK